ncbi:MAG TPA: ABC transporter ATP-binding protein [Solirubrobacteraceae bacterium]|jgi:oligopeptide/dipeptide ABC transporter ATP-binding protein|nr:ABC transporter ATP-binding protein [Solirubrobacteraceae bacterium]
MSVTEPILAIHDLKVGISGKRRDDRAIVRGVSLEVAPHAKLGIVGESGSGKSLTTLSVLQLLPAQLTILEGQIEYAGEDLMQASSERLREVRGGEIAMVYQDPMRSLNPLLRIGYQIVETLRAHGVETEPARRRTEQVLRQVGLSDTARVSESYPHQLSGGMLQRAMIAMALATSPKVLIADEPTTALDVTIQQQILDLVAEIQADTGMAVVWVTHDLGVVAQLVDRVAVMYAGRIVEQAPTRAIFERPAHPYTAALLGSLPRPDAEHRGQLEQIGGSPPDPLQLEAGCPFRARCPYAIDRCAEEEPALLDRGAGQLAACWREPELWQS